MSNYKKSDKLLELYLNFIQTKEFGLLVLALTALIMNILLLPR